MSSKKKIDVKPPKFVEDALLKGDRNRLSGLFQQLTAGDFLDPDSELGFLNPTVSFDPEVTGLALQEAQGTLNPLFQRQREDLRNEIINLGGGTSSTLASSLTRQAADQESQFQGIVAGAALEDRSRALNNIVNLFGTGLNVGGTSIEAGLASQNQRNEFEQRNFENQLALAQLNQNNRGGIAGALTGGIGGAALGIGLAPFTGGASLALTAGLAAGGAAAGGFGPSGTGGSILSAGSGIAGARFGGLGSAGKSTSIFASNDPFGKTRSFGGAGLSDARLDDLFAGLRG